MLSVCLPAGFGDFTNGDGHQDVVISRICFDLGLGLPLYVWSSLLIACSLRSYFDLNVLEDVFLRRTSDGDATTYVLVGRGAAGTSRSMTIFGVRGSSAIGRCSRTA